MSNFDMFQNSGYVNNRNRKRTLILDVADTVGGTSHLGAGTEFNIELFEPLIIDKHSEVYLDNCLTFNSNIGQNPQTSAFVLKIKEFNMNSNVASTSNNNTIFNSLVIPNDHKSVANNHGAVVHKGKKFNYVCDINPQTIHSLTGTITDLTGAPMFHSPTLSQVFTYSLTGIDPANYSNKTGFPIDAGSAAVLSVTGAGAAALLPTLAVGPAATAVFLATHFEGTTVLHFSTDIDIGALNRDNNAEIEFAFSGGKFVKIQCDAGLNPNLTLVQNPGRFIAEFSIISV